MNTFSLRIQKSRPSCTGLLFILAAAFIGAIAADLSAAELTSIRVRDRVDINSEDVLLGQIALIEGADAQFVQQLQEILIGRAPLPGKSRKYDESHLKMRLKQHDIDLSTVILEVAQHVEVSRSYVEIQNQRIKEIVSDFILQNIPQENRTVRIKEIEVPENVILSKGRIAYKVLAPRSRPLMGKCSIAVEFSVDGHSQKKVWATATVQVLGPVVVTRRPLGRYKPISADDIELQTIDLADLPDNVISDPEAVFGKRTKRAVGAQTPLSADIIELPPLVKRGDLVVIVAETDTMKITTLGQVRKKGRLGERIPVMNMDSKKILHARVLDSNTVKVDF